MKTAKVAALPSCSAGHNPAEDIARLQEKVLAHDEAAQAMFEAILDALAKHGNSTHHVKALATAGRDLFTEWACSSLDELPVSKGAL